MPLDCRNAQIFSRALTDSPGMELDDWLMAKHEFVTLQILRYQTIVIEGGGVSIKGLQRFSVRIFTCVYEFGHLPNRQCKADQNDTPNMALTAALSAPGWLIVVFPLMPKRIVLLSSVLMPASNVP